MRHPAGRRFTGGLIVPKLPGMIHSPFLADLLPLRPSFEATPRFLLDLAPLAVYLVLAAVIDTRTRKIPNWLTLGLLLGGLLRGATGYGLGGAVLGMLAGFAAGFPLFVLGARGAGDAKLYTATGAWLGWQGVVVLFLVEAVVGGVVVVAQCAVRGKLPELLRNTGVLVMTLVQVRRVGVEQAAANGRRFTSVDKKLPHAVPFLMAAVITLALGLA